VNDLNERGKHAVELLSVGHRLAGLDHRASNVLGVATAALASLLALGRGLSLASSLGALQLALGLGAGGRLAALPVALGLLAHGGAHRLGGDAGGTAVSRGAHGLALRAVLRLTQILRAAHIALGLVAVDLALSARGLLALNLALGALAHRVALGRARRIVTLPTALRVARTSSLHGLSNNGGKRQSNQQNYSNTHFEKEINIT